jgi:hypothetical protein
MSLFTINKANFITAVQIVFVIIGLFSTIINGTYFKTSAFIEVLAATNLLLYFLLCRENHLGHFEKILCLFAGTSIIIACYCLTKTDGHIDGVGKEAYRVLFIPIILLSLSLLSLRIQWVLKVLLCTIWIGIAYEIYEFWILNIAQIGFEKLPFYNAINSYYGNDVGGQYFKQVGDFGFIFYRPFGIWLQPQRSSFLFPLGIIVIYIYDKYFREKPHILRRNLFILFMAVLTFIGGGKTALLLSVILITIIAINYKNPLQMIVLCLGVSIALIWFIYNFSFQETINDVVKDIFAIGNLRIDQILFGLGFTDQVKLASFSFTTESSLMRLFAQFGMLAFGIITIFAIAIFLTPRLNRIDILLMCFLLFATIHYSVISHHYIMIASSLLLLTNYKLKRMSYPQSETYLRGFS